MSKESFVKDTKRFAEKVAKETGFDPIAILAQAALESGWGKYAVGFSFFGQKDFDGINGNEQLLTTTEYHKTMDVKYPVIISITPVIINGQKKFKYKVKDYFRKYPSPYESFKDHALFLQKNKRYAKAIEVRSDGRKFLEEIAKAGYATDPQYRKKILWCYGEIEKLYTV